MLCYWFEISTSFRKFAARLAHAGWVGAGNLYEPASLHSSTSCGHRSGEGRALREPPQNRDSKQRRTNNCLIKSCGSKRSRLESSACTAGRVQRAHTHLGAEPRRRLDNVDRFDATVWNLARFASTPLRRSPRGYLVRGHLQNCKWSRMAKASMRCLVPKSARAGG